MAQLPDDRFETAFTLLKRLATVIDLASATEWALFDRYGETEETAIELEELSRVKEKLQERYAGLSNLLLKIMMIQPVPSRDMLESLERIIERSRATIDAAGASIAEVKRNWDLS